jgi:chromosome segregation ATPase
MTLLCRLSIAATALTLSTCTLAAQAPPTADSTAAIARSLERIAVALERIERAQGFQIWLARAEVAAVGQRELERQLTSAAARVDGHDEERRQLEATLERLDELARSPDYPVEQADAERRQIENRLTGLREARRDAEARRAELESRLVAAERQVQDLLADIDRQMRAP